MLKINKNTNLIFCKIPLISQATLTISTVNGVDGNPVYFSVMATGISDMVGFQFTIAYDSTKLSYANCTNWGGGENTSSSALLITRKSDEEVTSFTMPNRLTFLQE